MKTFTRFAIAAILMFSVAFMSVNHAWAANPAQTTGGAGSSHFSSGEWFVDFPNGSLKAGTTVSITSDCINFEVIPWPRTGQKLHVLCTMGLGTSGSVGQHLVCFRTAASGGAIFWWESTLHSWVALANSQSYPLFDGVEYTCVNTWYTGTFAYAYVVP